MGFIIGPTSWWQSSLISVCPTGTTLPDGSRIICKACGTAWIVAPSCTQVVSQWAGGQYNATSVGTRCCIFEWPGLQAQLINCGFNFSDWFVPSISQLINPGYICRSQWDTFCSTGYWSSSTETNATVMCVMCAVSGGAYTGGKTGCYRVRAFRCVTY